MVDKLNYLLLQWFDVIRINVSIANRMNKVARLQTTNMSNHVSQQRIACYVEWYTQTLLTIDNVKLL